MAHVFAQVMTPMRRILPFLWSVVTALAEPVQLSGIYPHLAVFNQEMECGIGAVVPWAGRLWVVTYAPHSPQGSSDKLYEITPSLESIIRPESIGGTPANRMIHRESQQLFIGPHAIRSNGEVRTIPYHAMFGRPTGNARSLADPAGKILYATMEEGIYEVDVNSINVTELWGDEQNTKSPHKSNLPGYHGKGFYSGQGVYVYSNNGERGMAAQTDPTVPSGVLAEWDGKADRWTIVRRNQFTEVTGPGGIHGNVNPATDPIWVLGWDSKSLLLAVRGAESGWSFFRLPKGSHSYDGAHGWNTEWPRIRDIGEQDFLMTMHGTLWRFPRTFTAARNGGIRPRSNHLKVIGDFCRWQDRIVFGCDDTAKSEFLNKRKAKGEIAAPQSQSNLWFLPPAQIDHLGPAIGRGAVWMRENLAAGAVSDAYLFAGYRQRGLHLAPSGPEPWQVVIETSQPGKPWTPLSEITVSGYQFVPFDPDTAGEWIRLRSINAATGACAAFTYCQEDTRSDSADPIFLGVARMGKTALGGILRARDGNRKTLSLAVITPDGKPGGYYELDEALRLQRVDDPAAETFTRTRAAIPTGSLTTDAASAIITDDVGKRWRLPKGDPAPDTSPFRTLRLAREVATERDLLNVRGTFYELPANNAGGYAKMRAVATHNHLIHDFCSYRGLLVLSGVMTDAAGGNPHILRSADGKAALWAGALDDIWKLGKPRGRGGPWCHTQVKANEISDPYLLSGFDRKSLLLRREDSSKKPVSFTAQIDLHGDGTWVDYQTFQLVDDQPIEHTFPRSFSAYWIRFKSHQETTATAMLTCH